MGRWQRTGNHTRQRVVRQKRCPLQLGELLGIEHYVLPPRTLIPAHDTAARQRTSIADKAKCPATAGIPSIPQGGNAQLLWRQRLGSTSTQRNDSGVDLVTPARNARNGDTLGGRQLRCNPVIRDGLSVALGRLTDGRSRSPTRDVGLLLGGGHVGGMIRANRDTTRATPLGGGLGGHGESADVAPGELGHVPGGNNAVDVNLKEL